MFNDDDAKLFADFRSGKLQNSRPKEPPKPGLFNGLLRAIGVKSAQQAVEKYSSSAPADPSDSNAKNINTGVAAVQKQTAQMLGQGDRFLSWDGTLRKAGSFRKPDNR